MERYSTDSTRRKILAGFLATAAASKVYSPLEALAKVIPSSGSMLVLEDGTRIWYEQTLRSIEMSNIQCKDFLRH